MYFPKSSTWPQHWISGHFCNVATCTWDLAWAFAVLTPIWVLVTYLIKYSALHWNQSFTLVVQCLKTNWVFDTLDANLCTDKWACILIMARQSPGFEMGKDLERLSSDKYPVEVRNLRQLWSINIHLWFTQESWLDYDLRLFSGKTLDGGKFLQKPRGIMRCF